MDTEDLKNKVDAYLQRVGSAKRKKARREDAAQRTVQAGKEAFGAYVKDELRPGLEVIRDSLRRNDYHAEIGEGLDPNRAEAPFIELIVSLGGTGVVRSESAVFRAEFGGPNRVTFSRGAHTGETYSLGQLPRGSVLNSLLLDILKRCLPEPR